jgi:nucleoid DNA-binding protein
VLELLTKWLVKAKKVSIPSVGSLHVVHEPARYDVADKRILAPGYRIEFGEINEEDTEQLDFLSNELKTDKDAAENKIRLFGEKLAKIIKQQPVEWNGVGVFVLEQNKINFHSKPFNGLLAVDAPKVIHQGAQHVIRRGETEFTSAFEQQDAVVVPRKIKATTIGWILFLVALLFVIGWFFINKNNPPTGLQF